MKKYVERSDRQEPIDRLLRKWAIWITHWRTKYWAKWYSEAKGEEVWADTAYEEETQRKKLDVNLERLRKTGLIGIVGLIEKEYKCSTCHQWNPTKYGSRCKTCVHKWKEIREAQVKRRQAARISDECDKLLNGDSKSSKKLILEMLKTGETDSDEESEGTYVPVLSDYDGEAVGAQFQDLKKK